MQKMRSGNKRGISPLIATVLIVGAVIVIGLLVTLFLTSQVEQYLEKDPGPDCGFTGEFTIDMGVECASSAEGTRVNFINNGQEIIDLVRIICYSSSITESPAPSFVNLKEGAESSITYALDCEEISAFPGIVIEDDGSARARLCTSKEVNAQCTI